MRKPSIVPPRFFARRHVLNWVAEVLRTARAAYGDTFEYHMVVKRVMQIKRTALARFINA